MAIYCDNYATCNEHILGNENRARAAGWHLWEGITYGGQERKVAIGPRCVGRNYRPDTKIPPLDPGDEVVIQLEAQFDE